MARILISDPGPSSGHADTMRAAIIAAYGSDISDQIEIALGNSFETDLVYALMNEIVVLIRSTEGLAGFIGAADGVYDAVQCFVPLGSNNNEELYYPTTIPVIITSGAGDTGNDTAYGNGLEFWDDDNDGNPATDISSYSNGTVLGKILRIKDTRNCQMWEARYCARMTACNYGTWDKFNGYGKIDVAAAIAFAGPIPIDPYQIPPDPVSRQSVVVQFRKVETLVELE